MSITVLTPTGTLGYGFGLDALERGLGMDPDAIAVDAGSTDPGPYYLATGDSLVSRMATKRELSTLIGHSAARRIPMILGSAGGIGSRRHVDWTVDIVREIAAEQALSLRIAWIYSDVAVEDALEGLAHGGVQPLQGSPDPAREDLAQASALVAQMGHEPIVNALELGADVIVAGRACDESVIAAYPIARGADPALAIHMGKILECGAFSAEPFAMDVMLGVVETDHFWLEPGSKDRRASALSVAAHSLYERENPYLQYGPGYQLDLSACSFDQATQRCVSVAGSRLSPSEPYYVKLEGAATIGYRTLCIAGIRCPTTTGAIDALVDDVREATHEYFAPEPVTLTCRLYGQAGVMGAWEPNSTSSSYELGVLIDVVAASQDLARAACHYASGRLLHLSYSGQFNTSGNLAFPYSPSDIDAGPATRWCVYHLLRTEDPAALFPVHWEDT